MGGAVEGSGTAPATLFDTAGLLVMIALVALRFVGVTLLAGRAGNPRPQAGAWSARAHHYPHRGRLQHCALFFSLVFQGQQGITLLAGTLDGRTAVTPTVNYTLIMTTGIALVQVIAVVMGTSSP